MYDIVLKNGMVMDPAGRICGELQVAINGSRVARITDENISGKTVYDCRGLIVAPGFVDIHAHEDPVDSDGSLKPVITERLLRMGVTTFVGGQCGQGPDEEKEYSRAYNKAGQPVNCALLTGHESLRRFVGEMTSTLMLRINNSR